MVKIYLWFDRGEVKRTLANRMMFNLALNVGAFMS